MANPSLYPLDFDQNSTGKSSIATTVESLEEDRYLAGIQAKLEQNKLLSNSIGIQNTAANTFDYLANGIDALKLSFYSFLKPIPPAAIRTIHGFTFFQVSPNALVKVASFNRLLNIENATYDSFTEMLDLSKNTVFHSKTKCYFVKSATIASSFATATYSFFNKTISLRSGPLSGLRYGRAVMDNPKNTAYIWEAPLTTSSGTNNAGLLSLLRYRVLTNTSTVLQRDNFDPAQKNVQRERTLRSESVPNKVFNGRIFCFSVNKRRTLPRNNFICYNTLTNSSINVSSTTLASMFGNTTENPASLHSISYHNNRAIVYSLPSSPTHTYGGSPFIRTGRIDLTTNLFTNIGSWSFLTRNNARYTTSAPSVLTFPESTVLLFGKHAVNNAVYRFGYNHNHLTNVVTPIAAQAVSLGSTATSGYYGCSTF